jgi:phosphohistidine swiveling domain-containing protein
MIVAALTRVVESAYSGAATHYRRQLHVASTLRRAVILQRQLQADITGTAQSRGIDGRGDSILIDFARGRSATASVSFDLVDGTLLAVAPDVPLDTTPSWMNRLAGLVVALDTQLGGTVVVEFAIEQGQLHVLSLRRAQVQERTTWISDGGPMEAESFRLPRFVRQAYGDAKMLHAATNDALGSVGTAEEAEIRDEDGVFYLNVAVLRRALGQLALAVLLREPLWQLFKLSRTIGSRVLGKPPEVTGDLAASFKQFKSWQQKSLAPVFTLRLKLALRRWLVEWMIGMLSDGATGEPVPRVHAALRKILSRDARTFANQAERAKQELGEVEQPVRDFAAQIMARGATDWNAVFVGDRHLHAGVEELGRWATQPLEREAIAAGWDQEKREFEARRLVAVPPRLVEPPPPASLMSQADSTLRVVGLVDGHAEGLAVSPSELKNAAPAGCVVVLTDGRPENAVHVVRAGGVVIAGGGLLSPMAQLARELGIPTVACIDRVTLARFTLGQPMSLDGTTGGIVF